ncbi:MAG: preprotein translocase subunit SecA [Anaerolineaceae bacterium]|nr:preprotein translocase subunit SecA [Anaerolineaceae bacterium]
MFRKVVKSVFGDPMERAVNKYRARVEQINALEPQVKALSDEQLLAKTEEFKQRLANGEALDDLLNEAFALVREAAIRTIGQRHYDVQIIGGMVLHEGRIAEMKTGEGKTLVATLPLYLNALMGKGVHLVTPNDYLSKSGLQLMGPIYHKLGLSAAVIQNTGGRPDDGSYMFDPDYLSDDARYQNLRPITRREAYRADVTYGTNNEFGFDYLRDNMVWDKERLSQRPLFYAIVDEVDNILIDEARTPLIISGPSDEPSEYYGVFAAMVKQLTRSSDASVDLEEPDGDYIVDEKDRVAYLTEAGVEKIEKTMSSSGLLKADSLYHPENAEVIPYLDNCLRARALYHRDKEYVIQDGEIVIVDDFTGRLMPGRRFSEGLHQAIEAKEGVKVRRENMTMATITFQNFFRMYEKLAGMTGTALTEQEEFEKIYELDVVAIPTNRPVIREDNNDLIYVNEKAKWAAITDEIRDRLKKGQPILVGTVAIETSERLAKELNKALRDELKSGEVRVEVLNAKQHEREAGIIAQAGRPATVTIATNMAGRGVDILLGGNPEGMARESLKREGIDITEATPEQWQEAFKEAKAECDAARQRVLDAGGLYVMGTERHEARRIDNQLRGRSGRQGDPGETRFFLSLEDDLVRRFNGEAVKKIMSWANLPEDEPLEHGMISKSIEQAQIRVEGHNFDIRKRVLDYDDVVNRQRSFIYNQRKEWLERDGDDMEDAYFEMIEGGLRDVVAGFAESEIDDDTYDLLYQELLKLFPVPQHLTPETMSEMEWDDLEEAVVDGAHDVLDAKMQELDSVQEGLSTRAMRQTVLRAIDIHWQRHLTALDELREGIGLMGIAQRDPLTEYQREAFQMFDTLQDQITEMASRMIYAVQVERARREPVQRNLSNLRSNKAGADVEPQTIRNTRKLGRNDPCWCGSGKKYKQCHYKSDRAGITSPAEKAAVES